MLEALSGVVHSHMYPPAWTVSVMKDITEAMMAKTMKRRLERHGGLLGWAG
jgi:hypothetical protein